MAGLGKCPPVWDMSGFCYVWGDLRAHIFGSDSVLVGTEYTKFVYYIIPVYLDLVVCESVCISV